MICSSLYTGTILKHNRILLLDGLFLLFKSNKEIYDNIEGNVKKHAAKSEIHRLRLVIILRDRKLNYKESKKKFLCSECGL
jgi:hypothetical protein